ncbi:MAG: glycosyltransferase family 2 protein, partial [Caulobacteraceae bacterium]|nr:glycosyltransferase family 2 protein [Caulobacteraceae bacterium]
MTAPPEISCVVPTYESLVMARRCLASISRQEAVRVQIVVTDDSIRPDVRADLQRLARSTPGAEYYPGPRSGNPADNWNAGLERARGRYSVLIHHDEALADPTFLRRAVDRLEAEGAHVLVGDHALEGASLR